MLAVLFCGEFLLHISCWLSNLGSFFYTSRSGFIFIWGVSLKHPVLASFLCGVFLLYIPCWLCLCGEFLLHNPCCLHFYVGTLTHPVLAFFSFFFKFFFYGAFVFYVGWFSYISRAGFFFFLSYFFIWGVSLTHLVLALIWPSDFLVHIPCWLQFNQESFSYTSQAGFVLCGEFILHIPSWLPFHVGSLSYTSRAGFCSGVMSCCSSAVYSEDSSLRKELGGSWPRRKVWKSHSNQRRKEVSKLVFYAQSTGTVISGRQRRKPYSNLNRAEQNQTRTERKVGTGMKGEEKKWIWALHKP